MGRGRTLFGVLISVIYLIWMAVLILPKLSTVSDLALNEIGDFFAGIFGPLAFLWLVLGYLQQGAELRQNVEALRLQAEELKNSVDQQKQLVAATKEQIEHERNAYKASLQAEARKANPIFSLKIHNVAVAPERYVAYLDLMNSGAEVSDLNCTFSGVFGEPLSLPIFSRGKTVGLNFVYPDNEKGVSGRLTIAYINAVGVVGCDVFDLCCYSGATPYLEFSRNQSLCL